MAVYLLLRWLQEVTAGNRYLAHTYAAEALCMLNRPHQAEKHLSPSLVRCAALGTSAATLWPDRNPCSMRQRMAAGAQVSALLIIVTNLWCAVHMNEHAPSRPAAKKDAGAEVRAPETA